MNGEISDVVILERDYYDELVKKASLSEGKILEKAKKLYAEENEIPVRIDFSVYQNAKNFKWCFGFKRGNCKEKIHEELNKMEPLIRDWMDDNLKSYAQSLRVMQVSERDCIGLKRHVGNLSLRIKKLEIRLTWAICCAITLAAYIVLSLIK